MHKNASPSDKSGVDTTPQSGARIDSAQPAKSVSDPQSGLNRRDFIKRSGLALAGAAAVSTFVGPRRVYAAGPVELTFASAKFYGKQTIAEVGAGERDRKSTRLNSSHT